LFANVCGQPGDSVGGQAHEPAAVGGMVRRTMDELVSGDVELDMPHVAASSNYVGHHNPLSVS
jgi:hypothetical protein